MDARIRGFVIGGLAVVAILIGLTLTANRFRYQHFLIAFDGPKEAILKSYDPILGMADGKPPAAAPELALAFGRITYRRMVLEENVAVASSFVVVNRNDLLTKGRSLASSYVLWQTVDGGYVGNATQPSIVKTYHPIEVTLLKQEGKRYQVKVECSAYDAIPLEGTHWYENR
jgi:hypothetical protein